MNIKEIAFGDLVEIARRYQSVSTWVLHDMITNSKAFRAAKKGETIFSEDGKASLSTTDSNGIRFLIPKREAIGKHTSTSIRVEDIYGGDMEIPEGYKFVRFGIPKATELLLSRRVHSIISVTAEWDSPRIIVEKI